MPVTKQGETIIVTPRSNKTPKIGLAIAFITLAAQATVLAIPNLQDANIVALLLSPAFFAGINKFLKTPRISFTWHPGTNYWQFSTHKFGSPPSLTPIPLSQIKFRLTYRKVVQNIYSDLHRYTLNARLPNQHLLDIVSTNSTVLIKKPHSAEIALLQQIPNLPLTQDKINR